MIAKRKLCRFNNDPDGEVAEWLKAAARKGRYTVQSRIGGSNPSPLRQLRQQNG